MQRLLRQSDNDFKIIQFSFRFDHGLERFASLHINLKNIHVLYFRDAHLKNFHSPIGINHTQSSKILRKALLCILNI